MKFAVAELRQADPQDAGAASRGQRTCCFSSFSLGRLKKKGAPRPVVELITGDLQEKENYKQNKSEGVFEEHACLSSSQTKLNTKTLVHEANPITLDPRSSVSFRFLVPEVLKYTGTHRRNYTLIVRIPGVSAISAL